MAENTNKKSPKSTEKSWSWLDKLDAPQWADFETEKNQQKIAWTLN